MQIDTEHLHYWMQAIRQSPEPIRTMDAFWSGQLKGKEWLIKNIRSFITKPVSIDIHGGWVGVLASMLFQSEIPIKNIRSIDIDPHCESIATMMNKGEEIQGRFTAITADMCSFKTSADIIINTSCEHITELQYNNWLNNINGDQLIVLQSNNYNIPEHIRCSSSLLEFEKQSNLNILKKDELVLPMYTRYMLIGYKR